MKTKTYIDINQGDWVKCVECGSRMLLPYTADKCPECGAEEKLQWVDECTQETTVSFLDSWKCLDELERTNRRIFPVEYFTPQILKEVDPEEYETKLNGTIQHSDYYKIIDAIRKMEVTEVMKALEAHGGTYSWDYESEPCPIVSANLAQTLHQNPVEVEITKACEKDGELFLEGVNKEWGYSIDIHWSEVIIGHLSSIISHIPATPEVFSVAQNAKIQRILDIMNE
jgi:hypothetical protein